MSERFVELLHHLIIVMNVDVVVQADECVLLFVNGLDSLFRAYHEGKHLRVPIRIIRCEVALTDLPRAEEFGRKVR